jgi:tRNA(Ile)-lysidine synthetase-like protein
MDSSGADIVQRVHQSVAEALDRCQVLTGCRRIVVAVSGGADSLCMLNALVSVVPDAGERLAVGHVDHRLRPESAEDAEYVRQAASKLGVACTIDSVSVSALAQSERIGIEEAARIGRYRSLARFASSLGTDTVLTGHTRDDSVETIVLNLLRGTGARGLGGIGEAEWLPASSFDPTSDGPAGVRVIRPLLQVDRADTTAYCEARGIRYLTDATNADPRFARNRIRAHLLPVLRTYNPAIDRALVRMAKGLADEDRWLDEVAIGRWAEARVDPGMDGALSLANWRQVPLPLQRRIVRLIAESHGLKDLGFDAVERALQVGREDGPRQAQLGNGLLVKRQRTQLLFFKQREGTL